MSIIYDALQKTQRNREYLRLQNALTQKKPHRRNTKWMVLGSLILIVSAGVGAVISFYGLPSIQVTKFPSVAKSFSPVSVEGTHLWVSDSKKSREVPLSAPIENKLAVRPVVAQAELVPQILPRVESRRQPLTVKPEEVSEPEPVSLLKNSKLTLNGVMISGQEKIALINNQSYHLGDMVEGMKIVGIEFNNVKLLSGKQVVELRVPV